MTLQKPDSHRPTGRDWKLCAVKHVVNLFNPFIYSRSEMADCFTEILENYPVKDNLKQLEDFSLLEIVRKNDFVLPLFKLFYIVFHCIYRSCLFSQPIVVTNQPLSLDLFVQLGCWINHSQSCAYLVGLD